MKRNNSGLSVFIIILILAGLSNIGYLIVPSVIMILAAVIAAVLLGFFITFIVKLFTNNKKDNSKNDESILELLSQAKENKIVLDEDVYILITDPKNIRLDNVDIYLRDEYIGCLDEYRDGFPFAYDNLVDAVSKQFKRNKKKSSKKEKIKEVIKEEVVDPIINENNCKYYISVFEKLKDELDNQQVIDQVEETIVYLKEIKRIEDEFGESKDKTRKLYQYYLPMYTEILANYDRLDDNQVNVEELKENEVKLLKTAALINTALKTLQNSLTESYYTDLKVNMKTLESVLKKDGLIDDEISKEQN